MSVSYRYLIERTVRLYHGRPAVVCGRESRSFEEVYERACRLANALATRGCREGDRIGVLLPNCLEFVEVDVGLALGGFVRVSLNVRATAANHQQVLSDSGASALIYSVAFADTVGATTAALPKMDSALCVAKQAGFGGDDIDYEAALSAAPNTPPAASPRPDAVYCLFYTSGTTGQPKGVVLSHRAYLAVVRNLLLEYGPVSPGERILLPQPVSHGAGFFVPAWFVSGGVSIMMERYDVGAMLELAQRHSVETLKAVPTMLLDLLGADACKELPHLRQIVYGGAPMPRRQLEDLLDEFGPVFAQLYGQAEAPMCITTLPRNDHLATNSRILASAGRPFTMVEVHVVDAEGRHVQPGERGEVVVRGDHLMTEYWGQPELTSQVLRDGYVHTRDFAEMDERGYVYLLGRTDDMIISGGFNIAPRAVEEVLERHPAISEAVVVGLPHERLGQEVTAFVSLRTGYTVSPDELIEYARKELDYQRPRRVTILERLPRNAYGKVVRQGLEQVAGVV